jgi:hypothetical protein
VKKPTRGRKLHTTVSFRCTESLSGEVGVR